MSGKNLTFSGTDTIAFIILPNTVPIVLGSLTTFSHSSYRVKRPVNTIGGIHIKGVAKGGRVVAGTMVFTMVNKHWIKEMCQLVPWLTVDTDTIYSDELPLFDVMIVSANEYGKYVSMMIYGVDLTDEAQVLSVNDMYTENTFSFIAREVKTFDNNIITKDKIHYSSNKLYSDIKFDILNWDIENSKTITSKQEYIENKYQYDSYIKELQEDLKELEYEIDKISGIVDEATKNSVFDIMDRMDIDDKDFDEFIQDIYPDLNKDYIDDNSFYTNKTTDTYTSIPTESNINKTKFGKFNAGERVIVLDKVIDGDNEYYKTIYGLVNVEDVDYIDDKSNIYDVTIGSESVLNKINDVIEISTSLTKFLDELYIYIETDNEYEYISNAMIYDGDTGVNCIKKNIISKPTDISFLYAKDHLIKNYRNEMIVDFIVAGIAINDNVVISVKFTGGI